MFTALISTARPAPPLPPAADDGKPKFPQYLLPSLRLPAALRRGRTSQRRHGHPIPDPSHASPSDSSSSKPPSLSTSPSSDSDCHCFSSSPYFSHPTVKSHLEIAQPDTIRCLGCRADLAFGSQIISKGFHGRHGRAFLVSPPPSSSPPTAGFLSSEYYSPKKCSKDAKKNLLNIRLGPSENRQLVTGAHVVADIFCTVCEAKLGWKYVDAKAADQKYKVGKFILETAQTVVEKHWEDATVPVPSASRKNLDHDREEAEDDDGVVVFDLDDEEECDDMFSGVWDPEVVARRREERVARRG